MGYSLHVKLESGTIPYHRVVNHEDSVCRIWFWIWRRSTCASVIHAYHMNKWHWNSIILDSSVLTDEIKNMIDDSF